MSSYRCYLFSQGKDTPQPLVQPWERWAHIFAKRGVEFAKLWANNVLRWPHSFAWHTRPGEHTKSYWKWPFIVDFPMKNGDFPWQNVSSPEGIFLWNFILWTLLSLPISFSWRVSKGDLAPAIPLRWATGLQKDARGKREPPNFAESIAKQKHWRSNPKGLSISWISIRKAPRRRHTSQNELQHTKASAHTWATRTLQDWKGKRDFEAVFEPFERLKGAKARCN